MTLAMFFENYDLGMLTNTLPQLAASFGLDKADIGWLLQRRQAAPAGAAELRRKRPSGSAAACSCTRSRSACSGVSRSRFPLVALACLGAAASLYLVPETAGRELE